MFSLGIHRRALALTAVVAALVGGGLAAIAPASAEGDPVITWPTITALNPTTTDYPVTTSYDGADHLFLTVSAGGAVAAQPLPSNGTTPAEFPADYDGSVELAVAVCPTDTYVAASCARVGDAHDIAVYDELVTVLTPRGTRGPTTPFELSLEPLESEGTVDVSWEVRPAAQPDGAPVLSGAAHDVPRAPEIELSGLGAHDELVDGQRYVLRADVTATSELFGTLQGSAETEFYWDSVVDAPGIRFDVSDRFLNKVLRDVDVFYPARDARYEWRDELQIVVLHPAQSGEPLASLTVTIADPDGDIVQVVDGPRSRYEWNGRDQDGRLVPPGPYDVTVTVVDQQGNEASAQREVEVSQERLVHATWEKTIKPRSYLTDKFVGRCASLKMPARKSWRGSIGLRSSDAGPACRKLEAQTASTIYGIYLPRSPLGRYDRYDDVRVSTYGGGTPGTGYSYLVHWYWSTDGEWIARSQFDARLGWHAGKKLDSEVVHGDPEEEAPYILWSAGLAEGAKYDVRSFKVSVRYWDVR